MTQTITIQDTDSDTDTRTTTAAASANRRRLRRAATLIATAIAALIVWAISVPVLGLDLTVGAGATAQTVGPVSVGPVSVVVVPLVAGGMAWALLALLERLSARGRRAWKITGWAFLAVSLLGPLSMASGGVLVTLLVMHLVAGTTLILGLPTKRVV